MTLRFAYGTNGLGDHRLDDALALLADTGYDGVALTLDHHHLDPFAPDLAARVEAIARRLSELGLAVVVETGARFLLDPRRKHEPTLVSDDGRERRVDLLLRAVAVAADLGAPVVSLWSGIAPPGTPDGELRRRLVEGLGPVLDAADRAGVTLGFEPEPGMAVDRLSAFAALRAALDCHPRLGLTLDLGHCQCLEDDDVPSCVRAAAETLVHVQIEDMRRGVHEHLPFGEGEIDFPPVLAALDDVGYRGLVSVELTRHSHTAHTMVPAALAFLRDAAARSPSRSSGDPQHPGAGDVQKILVDERGATG